MTVHLCTLYEAYIWMNGNKGSTAMFFSFFFLIPWWWFDALRWNLTFQPEETGLLSMPHLFWNPRVIMMPTLSSLGTLQVVIATTCSVTCDDKVGIIIMMSTLSSLVTLQVVIATSCGVTSDDKVGIIIMMSTLSSLMTLQVVIATTCGVTSDDKVGIMTTLGFHYDYGWVILDELTIIRHNIDPISCGRWQYSWSCWFKGNMQPSIVPQLHITNQTIHLLCLYNKWQSDHDRWAICMSSSIQYVLCMMHLTLWDLNKMDHILQTTFSRSIFLREKFCILLEISLKFVAKGLVDSKSALF